MCTEHKEHAVLKYMCRFADVKNVTVRFPKTTVPSLETNYFCMTFDLPTDGDYHVIATTPVIDNVNVMHHMLLFGCDPGLLSSIF